MGELPDFKTIINLDKTCRLCLTENKSLKNLNSVHVTVDNKSTNVLNLLNRIIKTPLKGEDKSFKICAPCIDVATIVFKFKLQCESSICLLKEYNNNAFVTEQIILQPTVNDEVEEVDSKDFDKNISENEISTVEVNLSDIIKIEEDPEPIHERGKYQPRKRKNDKVNTPDSLKCEACDKVFPNKYALKYHSRCRRKKENEVPCISHSCGICGKEFSNKYRLKHHSLRHQNEKPFLCNICGKCFFSKTCLGAHLTIHGAKSYKCEDCGRTYTTSSNLKLHRLVHSNTRPYLCSLCGKAFRQPTSLQYHMRTHTMHKPHKCEYCGRLFALYGNYATHKLLHTGVRPFSCEICGKGFVKKYDMNRHFTIRHSDKKDFLCIICGKQFACEIYHRQHMMKHTKEWSHICTICNKGFSRPYSLRLHQKKCTVDTFEEKKAIQMQKEKEQQLKIDRKREYEVKKMEKELAKTEFVDTNELIEANEFVETDDLAKSTSKKIIRISKRTIVAKRKSLPKAKSKVVKITRIVQQRVVRTRVNK